MAGIGLNIPIKDCRQELKMQALMQFTGQSAVVLGLVLGEVSHCILQDIDSEAMDSKSGPDTIQKVTTQDLRFACGFASNLAHHKDWEPSNLKVISYDPDVWFRASCKISCRFNQ